MLNKMTKSTPVMIKKTVSVGAACRSPLTNSGVLNTISLFLSVSCYMLDNGLSLMINS
jgi:hypothetical protein